MIVRSLLGSAIFGETLVQNPSGRTTRRQRMRQRTEKLSASLQTTYLQPWIEYEKTEHINRAVATAKRGFECIPRVG